MILLYELLNWTNHFKRLWSDFCFGLVELACMHATDFKPWNKIKATKPVQHGMYVGQIHSTIAEKQHVGPQKALNGHKYS